MKSTIVPAQITSVEDKIAGNLGLSQLLLLVAPVFLGSAIFIALPPSLAFMTYKAVVIGAVALLCCVLAIRVKGRILLVWATVMLRYNLRPRYYIFNKNDPHLRTIHLHAAKQKAVPVKQAATRKKHIIPDIDIADVVKLRHIMADPKANLHFKKDRKGALRVYITEVK